jgi:hypothetical protein
MWTDGSICENWGIVDATDARRQLLKSARGLRVGSEESELDAMAALSHYVIDQLGSGHEKRVDRVLDEAEKCFSAGDGAAENLIWVGLVENLGNIASHADVPVSPAQIRSRLGPHLKDAWDQVDAFWLEVAPHKPALDPEGKSITIAQYESVTSPQLGRQLQQMHRRTEDGALVSLGDVLRYEASTGRSMGRRR